MSVTKDHRERGGGGQSFVQHAHVKVGFKHLPCGEIFHAITVKRHYSIGQSHLLEGEELRELRVLVGDGVRDRQQQERSIRPHEDLNLGV